ncbi:MAG: hypothetical protein AAGF77_01875 [Bacteroidota bacterium]
MCAYRRTLTFLFFIALIGLFTNSCSQESDEIPTVEDNTNTVEDNTNSDYIPLTLLGSYEYRDFAQFDIFADGSVEETSLNAELGLETESLQLSGRVAPPFALFYERQIASDYKIWQKNVVTGAIATIPSFCAQYSNDYLGYDDFGTSGATVFGYGRKNDTVLYIDLHKHGENTCNRIEIPFADDGGRWKTRGAKAYGDYLVFYASKSSSDTLMESLHVIDLNSQIVAHEFFSDQYISGVFIYNNELYISSGSGGRAYEVYDMGDTSPKRILELPSGIDYMNILEQPNIHNNLILLQDTPPQPSLSAAVPMVANIKTGDTVFQIAPDALWDQYETVATEVYPQLSEYDRVVSFYDYVVDLASERIGFLYRSTDDKGFIVFTDYDLRLLSFVELPFHPNSIILHK